MRRFYPSYRRRFINADDRGRLVGLGLFAAGRNLLGGRRAKGFRLVDRWLIGLLVAESELSRSWLRFTPLASGRQAKGRVQLGQRQGKSLRFFISHFGAKNAGPHFLLADFGWQVRQRHRLGTLGLTLVRRQRCDMTGHDIEQRPKVDGRWIDSQGRVLAADQQKNRAIRRRRHPPTQHRAIIGVQRSPKVGNPLERRDAQS